MSNKPSELYGQPWRKRDLVIALSAYIENRDKPAHVAAPWIVRVAEILGRTPASVLIVPPQREGLVKGGPLCLRVFNEWHRKPAELAATARFLIDEEEASASDRYDLFNPEPVRLPRAFGRYELLDVIASGGFGSVFSCITADSAEPRAIKVIKLELVQDKETLHRFYREIRTLKSVIHPTVIGIYEDNLETEEDFPAFVMDLAQCNLTEYVNKLTRAPKNMEERPRIGADESVEIMLRMFEAIEVLHQHRPTIIHRDLNPNNILLLADQRWVLADFGLAKFLHSTPLTTAFATGTTHLGIGTAYYAAPEQYRSFSSCRAYTDIYALGMLIWDLFSVNWPDPDRSDSGLPHELEEVFLRAAHRNPNMRYKNVADLRTDFLAAIECTWKWALPSPQA
jgi:hypothetical protein